MGRKDINRSDKAIYKEMLKNLEIIGFSDEIKEACIKLKQQYSIKTPDAIIAATSIVTGIPFVSGDSDFEAIKQFDFIKV